MIDCLSVGILVVDHLCPPIPRVPKSGELILVDRLPLSIGGCAANVAIDLARLGVGVGVVGCVGRDAFGQFVASSLATAGVEVGGLATLDDAETSGSLIINVAGEDRRFIHAAGANTRLKIDHIDRRLALSAKVLYVGGYLLTPALLPDQLAELFRAARAAGVVTVLDVVLPGAGDHWPTLTPVLAETDVFLSLAMPILSVKRNDFALQAQRPW
jgi:sugar/nucleoside kinase (ribokinase family)